MHAFPPAMMGETQVPESFGERTLGDETEHGGPEKGGAETSWR